MQVVAGHVSAKSSLAYRRPNVVKMAKLGGAVQVLAPGVKVKYPDFDFVQVRIGPRRRIRKLLGEEDDGGNLMKLDIMRSR